MNKIRAIQVFVDLPLAGLSVIEIDEEGILCFTHNDDKLYNLRLTWQELGEKLSKQFNTKQL